MTPEQSIKILANRIAQLQRRIRCGEVLYTGTTPTGAASCTYKLAVDYTTGDLFYKDDLGEWQPVPGGGGGGGGSTSGPSQIEAIVDFQNVVRNTAGIVSDIDGIADGSDHITFPDFADISAVTFSLGGTELPGIDPLDGSMYYTLSGDTITFTNGTLTSADKLKITW